MSALFGGVSFDQIARVFAVTLATVVAAGSLGSIVALWREKTFQTLALTVLALVFWLAAGEALAAGVLGERLARHRGRRVGRRLQSLAGDPGRHAAADRDPRRPALGRPRDQSLLAVRGRAGHRAQRDGHPVGARLESVARSAQRHAGGRRAREHLGPDRRADRIAPRRRDRCTRPPAKIAQVWDNPILWREIATWAYGRRVLAIRVAYLLLVGLAGAALHAMLAGHGLTMATGSLVLVPLLVLSLVLVNAQAVTSLTTERDGRALDLLLVTDLTAKEFVFGKLGGVFYNTKEMILLPMALCVYLWARPER